MFPCFPCFSLLWFPIKIWLSGFHFKFFILIRLSRFVSEILIKFKFETSFPDYNYHSNLELGFQILWSLAFKIWYSKWNLKLRFKLLIRIRKRSYISTYNLNSNSKLPFRILIRIRSRKRQSKFDYKFGNKISNLNPKKNSETKFRNQIWSCDSGKKDYI